MISWPPETPSCSPPTDCAAARRGAGAERRRAPAGGIERGHDLLAAGDAELQPADRLRGAQDVVRGREAVEGGMEVPPLAEGDAAPGAGRVRRGRRALRGQA